MCALTKKETRLIKKLIRRAIRRKAGDRFYHGDRLAKRARVARLIAERAEGGKVAIVYGGRDCDGVQVDNLVRIIPANVQEWERFVWQQERDAEGPTWAQVARPSDVRDLEPETHDLVMTAFENGHPHVIHPVNIPVRRF